MSQYMPNRSESISMGHCDVYRCQEGVGPPGVCRTFKDQRGPKERKKTARGSPNMYVIVLIKL